ncbi:KUP/HAK/KT family potassium transporter [Caenimonas terrae]|uniref:KUP/HAK/KT family potassium transporter n=1 Tax=Caenimonas terrae TaxID=696074 RepID=A0ABW0NIQ6_9BURK
MVGVLGASPFYGDNIITPAISVLSAVEDLEIVTPALKPYVLPVSLAILAGLFAVQRFGTGLVGKMFGPVIAVWFAVLAGTGAVEIARQPAILAALTPLQRSGSCAPRAGTCWSRSARSIRRWWWTRRFSARAVCHDCGPLCGSSCD